MCLVVSGSAEGSIASEFLFLRLGLDRGAALYAQRIDCIRLDCYILLRDQTRS